ncbi:MAG: immunoglobulin domain-containing protein, partial [Bacteroidota bacterium]
MSNVAGSATSNQATLTVLPPPSTIVSDDFNAATLNTSLWTFTNPGTPSTLSLVGTGTLDALLSIAVPGGSAHDVWTGGNNAPRIMQPANNIDFEVEAKFQSPMTAGSQFQGILVQANSTNFIRFDFVCDGLNTKIFVARFLNGTPTIQVFSNIAGTGLQPLYLRVKRQGNQWTESYSFNGTTFTIATTFSYTLAVSSVGLFVGNAGGSPPAFTGLVDYFFNTASPIVPEDGTVPPTITTHPLNQTVTEGQTATFSVTATGTPSPTYQWQKNNVDISGATSASHTTPATILADNGATFRCVVSNVAGTVTSNSATLTVTSGAPVSDNFNAGSLNTSLWTFTDPVGDAILTMTGNQVSMALPAGTSHDVWTGGNFSARIMQPVGNVDFEVEAKFDAALAAGFQIEGMIIQQDANNFLRFDFYHDGTS